MAIDKVKLPDNSVEEVRDSRIPGIDSAPTANSANLVTSGGVKSALDGKMDIGGVVSDFNTESNVGNYAISPDSVNGPNINYGQALFLRTATDTIAQLAFNYNSRNAFFRGGSSWGSSWNSWREFAFKDDLEQITFPISPRNFPNGTLVRTSIDYSTTSGAAFYMEIAGDVYGNGTVFTQVNGYIYSDTLINYGVYNLGMCRIPEMYAMNIDGYLCFWWPRIGYWHSFRVGVYASSAGDYSTNLVTSIDDAAHPSGTKEVTLSSNSYDSYFGDISSCAKLASPNNLIHSGNEFTFIPPNFSNGIWFNYRTSDYSSSGAVTEYNFGDGAGHALASITQGQFSGNAATATKLSTARTIWGQSFDGTGDVNGNIRIFHASDGQRLASFVNYESNPYGMVMESVTDGTFLLQSQREADNSETFALCLNPRGGNVGIGITSPAVKLDVNGDIRGSRVFVSGVNSYTFFDTTNNRVGIGIAQPSYKLDVWGEIRASSLDTYLQTSQPSGGMLPNCQYALGELSGDTTFSMAAGVSGVTNHYFWTFSTPSTAPTITWPAAITSWFGGSAPTINASKHYEVSVLDGVAICMEV